MLPKGWMKVLCKDFALEGSLSRTRRLIEVSIKADKVFAVKEKSGYLLVSLGDQEILEVYMTLTQFFDLLTDALR